MENKSILDVEESLQCALEALPSTLRSNPLNPLTQLIADAVKVGYHPVVELQENGRRKRRTASAGNWSPETGEILISFSKDESPVRDIPSKPPFGPAPTAPRPAATPGPGAMSAVSVPQSSSEESEENDVCRALEEVESQHRAFVALKWFRDDVLPAKGFAWATDADHRQSVLASAIQKGLIVTSRVPNPRSPYPTTAVRLNRAPASIEREDRRYAPIRIQGDPLSSTILRDRGTH
jgi:hypothetical protein